MKLTEKELNYILAESLEQMINEKTSLKQTLGNSVDRTKQAFKTGAKYVKNNSFDGAKNTLKNFANGYKNSGGGFLGAKTLGGVSNVVKQVPGGGMMGAGILSGMMFPNAGLPFVLSLLGFTQLLSGINRFRQLVSHKIPYNKNAAFQLALKALPEYQNSSKLCQTIQANFNLSCQAYENVALQNGWKKTEISWNDIKDKLKLNTFTLDIGDLKGIKGITNINQDFSKQGVNESTTPDMQKKQTMYTIQKYLTSFQNELDAQNFIFKIGELYSNAYHLYFKWKSYLKAIMMKFDISWEEIQKGQTESGKWRDRFDYKGDGAIDKEALSNEYTIIKYVKTETITLPENNKKYNYSIWKDQNNKFYAIYFPYLASNNIDTSKEYRFIYSNNMTNNKTIRFTNPSNGRTYKSLLLNDELFDNIEEVEQQQQQQTQQPQPNQNEEN